MEVLSFKKGSLLFKIRNVILGLLAITAKSAELILYFYSVSYLLSAIIKNSVFNEFMEMVNIIILLIILIYNYLFEVLEYAYGLKKKQIFFGVLVFSCIGMVDSKWWAGITILISLLSLALTEGFGKEYLKNTLDDEKKSFYQFLIPYCTLLFFISMIIVQEKIPSNLYDIIFNTLSNNGDKTNPPGPISIIILRGEIEFLIFMILWYLCAWLLKKGNFFNEQFCEELENIEKRARSKIENTTT